MNSSSKKSPSEAKVKIIPSILDEKLHNVTELMGRSGWNILFFHSNEEHGGSIMVEKNGYKMLVSAGNCVYEDNKD